MSMTAEEQVRRVIDRYVEASYSGDVEALQAIFHADALMAGFFDGRLDVGTPEPFFDDLVNHPSPRDSGEPYSAEISFVTVVDRVAAAGVVEHSLQGHDFVNQFLLLEIGGEWLIVAKAYDDHIDSVGE